jgi:hypothetical protein
MNKINEQQELLYEILHRKSDEMLACLHREKEAENSITYGLVFFRKTRQKIVPKIGIRVQFVKELFEDDSFSKVLDWFFEEDQGLEYRPRKVEIIGRGMLKELSIKKCLENYRHFVWYNSLSWTDQLFEIQDIAEVVVNEFLSGETKEVVGEDLTYLGYQVREIVPYFCAHINKDGGYNYEW